MNPVQFAISKPVTVSVGIILVVLFGLIGLTRLPYQLTPSVEEPEITVTTIWTGAAPNEVERDIIDEQEKVLKGIPGLVEMESTAGNNQGTVTLRFRTGTDVDDALLRVSNKLNEVPRYPLNVEKPVINATGAATSPVIWMILKADEGNPTPIDTYRTFFEEEVRQYLERIAGVADLFIGGGTERELHVVVSPEKLAAYGLTLRNVTAALQGANVNVSAGSMGVGRRDYRIRSVAEFVTPGEVERVVLRSTGQRRVLLSDVASVRIGYQKKTVAMIHNGEPGIAVGVKPEPGTNILELTDRVEEVVRDLNETILKEQGVHIDWAYDQRPYIRGAIGLVRQNIAIGGTLAILVLLVFLRSLSSTVIVATAIPISVIGTFIFLWIFGRNLNVVSLAGISFAVGMLLDSAIVVLENIDRHRKMGKDPSRASYDGAREVWGAILASSATTVAVFLPVVFVEEEVGQLFRDIAIAVTVAITLSLFVSVFAIPMLSNQIFRFTERREGRLAVPAEGRLVRAGNRLVDWLMGVLRLVTRTGATRLATVVILTVFSVLTVLALFPKMEYLPQGNRNLIINILIPPPGLSYEEKKEIGDYLFAEAAPYFGKGKDGIPGIRNMFYVGSDFINIFGANSNEEQKARGLLPLFTRVIRGIPGMFGVSIQAGIFQTRLGRGRTIDVDISGNDLNRVVRAAGIVFGSIRKEIPGSQVRPVPSLEISYPEVRFHPDRDRLRAAGMTEEEFGIAADVLMDGRKIGEYKPEGEKAVDFVLKASDQELDTPEKLYRSLVATPAGRAVPLSSLADLERTAGITEIRHLERKRTITLEVTPPEEIPLEAAMDTIHDKILTSLEQAGMLAGTSHRLSGAADKLTEARRTLQWDFLLALVITYLLMSALFENFLYPLIIMFTVPLAAAGGFIGLTLVNLLIAPQPMDILTMLGFVILIGVVVNNAILIVHQALNYIRNEGMEYREAVLTSARTRIRPIYMTAMTSIFGMLPLVVAPGPGSELYRGLGSVVLGGLALSTVFTLYVIPSLLLFFVGMEKTAPGPEGIGGAGTSGGRG
ncbi:MAG TPA: efflux RND transporter permease subunit [Candidatus Deferrimicrobiaceae bacterium]|nr:efflux RND transporter permease subunit [Candidatus Deferrimicrobiaceae bacterium]